MSDKTKDIEDTIADSQLNKLMGNEEKQSDDSWSTQQDDLWEDGLGGFLYNENEIVEDDYLPSYNMKPAKNKKKVARPRPTVSSHDETITDIVDEVFDNIITSFDSRQIVINSSDFRGLRKWIRECVNDSVVFDPDKSHYTKTSEVINE
tara:strand:+ start:1623 stop:2069 length:447 start_codon:yes stop_codon:yes gene_type:complete